MKKYSFYIVVIALAVIIIAIINNRKENQTDVISLERSVSESTLSELQPLFKAPIASIATDTISQMKDMPTHLICFAHIAPAMIQCLWMNQKNNPQAVTSFIKFDSIGALVVNSALARDSAGKFVSVTVRHAFPEEWIPGLTEWNTVSGADIIFSESVTPVLPHAAARISISDKVDSVVLCGYRILSDKKEIVFYSIKGKAIQITPEIQTGWNAITAMNLGTSEGVAPTWNAGNSSRCYVLQVPSDFFESVLGLSGAGVYRLQNGHATDELVGIQSQRMALTIATGTTQDINDLKRQASVWLAFQTFRKGDL